MISEMVTGPTRGALLARPGVGDSRATKFHESVEDL